MKAVDRWQDLLDPTRDEILAAAPRDLHPPALERLSAPSQPDRDERPTLQSHGDYLFGVLLVPKLVDGDQLTYQEIDLIITRHELLTVRKAAPGETAYDLEPAREECRHADSPGLIVFHVVDTIAEQFLELVDTLHHDIDRVEDGLDPDSPTKPPDDVRGTLSLLRRQLIRLGEAVGPTRDAILRIAENRLDIEGSTQIFPPDVEVRFRDTHDKLVRAGEALDRCRELLNSVRDYYQSLVASEQNEATQRQADAATRLTIIAALLLLPGLIVGVLGQNFHTPGAGTHLGFWISLVVIGVVTVLQLAYFKRKGWI